MDKVSKYGSVLGLDADSGAVSELGNPQESLKFIHIAGTNRKDCTCIHFYHIKRGRIPNRTYVSPTVVSYLERIQVDEEWIPEDTFARLTEIVQRNIVRMEAGKPSPTVFEVETTAFLLFKERNCDIIVWNVDRWGTLTLRISAENTVCAVFTSIMQITLESVILWKKLHRRNQELSNRDVRL